MDRAWYWKAGFIAAITVLAVWALVPSVTYFRMPAGERNEASAFEKARPKWAPGKHLNLGLDLQGGIHLVMGVEVDKAVREKAVRRAEEIAAELDRKGVTGADVKGDPDTGIVTVSAPDIGKVKDLVSEEYTDMFVRKVNAGSFELAMKDDAVRQLKESAVDQAVKAIRNRVDKWGVSEPTIAKRGDASILVQLPGYSNPEKAKELIGKTAQLEFKIVDDQDTSLTQLKDLPPGVTLDWDRYTGAGDVTVSSPYLASKDRALLEQYIKDKAPKDHLLAIGKIDERRPGQQPTYRTWMLDKKAGLTGEYITDARVAFDQSPGEGNRPYVQLTFNKTGADLFATLTKNNVKKRMAIVLDDTVDSAPIIQSEIPGGVCSIHLGGLKPVNEILDEAKDLALVLKSGALPAPVRILEERSVGASLGPELIRRGSLSALIGILAVLLFMAFYYRFSGVVADVALVLNGLVVLAIMALINSTLTLPGIAGFVLTLGMAVDANVLINERIREEMKTGKQIAAAVRTGYEKVFWTIFDGHVTALVAGFVIRAYGSGPVRGFATTLIIGLLASMFTSIVVTRAIVEWFVGHGRLHKAVSF
jgi:preprotein translocase subunit SecD